MQKRAEIIIKGRVQKAGYRDYIDEQAFDLGLTGSVKNLEDETVRVICEGDEEAIEKFIKSIKIKQYPIHVTDINVNYSDVTSEFKDFEIIREEDMTEATYERMDIAAKYMREMNSNLGEKIDNLGQDLGSKIESGDKMLGDKIESGNKMLGDKIDSGNKETHEFRTETKDNFNTLSTKYDAISQNMNKIFEELVKERKETRKSTEKLVNAILQSKSKN